MIKLLLGMLMFVSTSAYSGENSVQLKMKSEILAALATEGTTLLSEEAALEIKSIIVGQTYYDRVSIMNFDCQSTENSAVVYCEIVIGTDDTTDTDSGWGSLYKISIKFNREASELISAKKEIMAG